jgi:hypothetical protein
VAVDLAVVGVFVGGHEVFLIVKFDKAVAAGLPLLVANDPHGFNDAIFLGGKRLTSNSYFSVFSVVL